MKTALEVCQANAQKAPAVDAAAAAQRRIDFPSVEAMMIFHRSLWGPGCSLVAAKENGKVLTKVDGQWRTADAKRD